ncbi:MAG: putative universal stress protein [Anaerolineae bacterium]|nr:putative universal stress protein [Anaerolineae bacterium]
MYRKILVPLDGSETSEAVLPHAAALAKCTGARITLLRVITQPMYEAVFGDMTLHRTSAAPDTMNSRSHAEGYLQRVVFDYFENNDDAVAYDVCAGPVAETIMEYAASIEADLIAMSTHGRSGLARMMIGSVADEIVRRSNLPVLLVRPEE